MTGVQALPAPLLAQETLKHVLVGSTHRTYHTKAIEPPFSWSGTHPTFWCFLPTLAVYPTLLTVWVFSEAVLRDSEDVSGCCRRATVATEGV